MSYKEFDKLMEAHKHEMQRAKNETQIYKNLLETMIMINEVKNIFYKSALTAIGLYAGLYFGLKMIITPHA